MKDEDWVKIWEVSIGVYWFLLVSIGVRTWAEAPRPRVPDVAPDGGSDDRGQDRSAELLSAIGRQKTPKLRIAADTSG